MDLKAIGQGPAGLRKEKGTRMFGRCVKSGEQENRTPAYGGGHRRFPWRDMGRTAGILPVRGLVSALQSGQSPRGKYRYLEYLLAVLW